MLQIAAVEVPEESMGSVVELLGKRRGQMVDMEADGFVPYFHYLEMLGYNLYTILI
jgi:predicted membrane GTPase involved in stress response